MVKQLCNDTYVPWQNIQLLNNDACCMSESAAAAAAAAEPAAAALERDLSEASVLNSDNMNTFRKPLY
jgi:hypothetical protein